MLWNSDSYQLHILPVFIYLFPRDENYDHGETGALDRGDLQVTSDDTGGATACLGERDSEAEAAAAGACMQAQGGIGAGSQ